MTAVEYIHKGCRLETSDFRNLHGDSHTKWHNDDCHFRKSVYFGKYSYMLKASETGHIVSIICGLNRLHAGKKQESKNMNIVAKLVQINQPDKNSTGVLSLSD